ncbi:MAG: cytochrome c3 family protein [Thermodesulfovibrionales bacterium]
MSEEKPEIPPTRSTLWRQFFLAVCTALLAGVLIYGFTAYKPFQIGPEQPIPFSHRVHAGQKKISCFLCHPEAMRTARAGVPPLQTCMLCHARIVVTFPPVRKLREHYFQGKPVFWKRVYSLPDFVYFDHAVHLHRSIDCSACHGDVPSMDRITPVQEITMGFCIGCHKRNNATHDCFACHR